MSGRTGSRRHARWRLTPRLFVTRPKLVAAAASGVAAAAAMALLGYRPQVGVVVGWDAFCAVFLGLAALLLGQEPSQIRARAADEDEGQAVILLLVVAACAASLAAVARELSLAKELHGLARDLHVALAVATVAASWLVMQVVLALHYAHAYYIADPETGKDTEGLAFPGKAAPGYWDFVHFSIVIGVAAQTADIAITDPHLRRLATLHSLIAFVFNTLILALTINLAADLF